MKTSEPDVQLTESVICRLCGEAVTSFLSRATAFEASASPGLWVALCNEPIADMNMVVVGEGVNREAFTAASRSCLERDQPFLAIIFPEAGDEILRAAAELGLVHAVDFPMMVREDAPIEPDGNERVDVRRADGPADAAASAKVLSSAFGMDEAAVLSVLPPSLYESPAVDVFVARIDGEPAGTVTLTYHGDTCGIWAMGTDTARQRGGIGRRLLSTAMAHARQQGSRRFFLGATPAGYRLYEGLGFRTRVTTAVWVSGETNQA